MPHRTSSTTNDYERKINYDWPHYQSNPLIPPPQKKKCQKQNHCNTTFVLPNKMYSKPIKIARMTFKTQ